jgi:phage terminase large subunit GpA-like protein
MPKQKKTKYKKNLKGLDKILGQFHRILQPKESLTVVEWAEQNFYLSKKDSAEPGLISYARTPYARKIVNCMSKKHPAKKVTWKKASQVSASTQANVVIGYVADYEPAPIMLTMPSEKVVKRAARNRIDPMIEASPVLKKIFAQPRSKEETNSATEKSFGAASLYLASAASSNDLASISVRVAISDEFSKFPLDLNGEGSADKLIDRRLQTFGSRSKHFKISTPAEGDDDLVSKEFELGTQEYYKMPCPHCGGFIDFKFENLKWDKCKDTGEHLPHTVYHQCEHCEKPIYEKKHKTQMMENGDWFPSVEEPKEKNHFSFHTNGLYSPVGWLSWEMIANEWLRGHKHINDRKAFYNTVLGLVFKETNKDTPKVDTLMARRENYSLGVIPLKAMQGATLAGVDVQGDRLECTVRAFNMRADGTSEHWIIDHKIFYGNVDLTDPLTEYYYDPETGEKKTTPWQQLRNYLITPLPCEDGSIKPIIGVALDSGYKSHLCYQFSKRFSRGFMFVVKGTDELATGKLVAPFKMVDISLKNKKIKKGAKLYNISSNIGKKMVYDFIAIPQPTQEQLEAEGQYPPNYVHFPLGFEREYFDQLTAEIWMKVKDKKTGKQKSFFKKIRDRNETLDTFSYSLVAAHILQLDKFMPENFHGAIEMIEKNALEKFRETK